MIWAEKRAGSIKWPFSRRQNKHNTSRSSRALAALILYDLAWRYKERRMFEDGSFKGERWIVGIRGGGTCTGLDNGSMPIIRSHGFSQGASSRKQAHISSVYKTHAMLVV